MKGQISLIEGYTYDPDEIVIRRGRKHIDSNPHKPEQNTLKKIRSAHHRDYGKDENVELSHRQIPFSEVDHKSCSEN